MMRLIMALALALSFASPATAASPLKNGEHRAVLNGVRHWYRVAGAEHRTAPIVVVHGGPGGNSYNFERTVGPLIEKFATIVYYDQRGSGRSEAPKDDTAYAINLLADDIDALRQRLGADKITPLGFSFGAQLAMEYAIRYPEKLDRLILQSASNGDQLRIARYQAYGFALRATGERRVRLEAIATDPSTNPSELFGKIWSGTSAQDADRFLFHNQAAAKTNRRLWEENGLKNTGKMAEAIEAAPPRSPSLISELHKIPAPTLVMVGLYDRNVGVDMSREIAEALPNSKLVILEKSAHFPDAEEPERYAEIVRAFLTSGKKH